MKYFLLAILTLNLSCSVTGTPANKHLLDGRNPIGKPTDEPDKTEAGDMTYAGVEDLALGRSFSIFLWPNSPKVPLDKISEDVSLMSREIDRLAKAYREASERYIREQKYWSDWACDASDQPKGKSEIQDCSSVFPNGTKHDFCSCLADNKPLLEKLVADNPIARDALGKKIKELVEGDDDISTKNWLLGETAGGSTLKISRPKSKGSYIFDVYLKLINFGPENITYKTPKETPTKLEGQAEICDDGLEIHTKKNGTKVCIPKDTNPNVGRILYAEYNSFTKSLSFAILEKSNGVSTGNVYYFLMERGGAPEGATDLARFKGNFQKVGIVGQTLGIGAAKFDGDWTPQPEETDVSKNPL